MGIQLGCVRTMAERISGALMAENLARHTCRCPGGSLRIQPSVCSITWCVAQHLAGPSPPSFATRVRRFSLQVLPQADHFASSPAAVDAPT